MKPIANYFTDPHLLRQALTHRSYCNEHPGNKSNERLEFLGDSVLSLIISNRLYAVLPDQPEGELTARRSLLVQTATLADKALNLGLDQQLLLSKGEEDGGGRKNPSLLANVFEAVLGALYLDQGIERCTEFLAEVFSDSELTQAAQIKDPKSLLQETSQAKGFGTPIYKTMSATGPDHAKQFVVAVWIGTKKIAQGTGTSKQRAEADAAALALAKLT